MLSRCSARLTASLTPARILKAQRLTFATSTVASKRVKPGPAQGFLYNTPFDQEMDESQLSQMQQPAHPLAQRACVPCRKGTPKLTRSEVNNRLRELGSNWQLEPVSGDIYGLTKSYKFKNFQFALLFTNTVGTLAEEEGHHPRLVTEWGRVEVSWWTHAIGGLHENDFTMAAKTDEILRHLADFKDD